MRSTCKFLIVVCSIAFSQFIAKGQSDPTFDLDMKLSSLATASKTSTPQQTLAQLKVLLATTPADLVQKIMEQRSNLESGFLEVIAKISERGGHAQALEALDALDERIPTWDGRAEIVAAKAKLLLRLGKTDDALALARTVRSEICGRDCPADVRRWVDDGAVPVAKTATDVKRPWIYDERGGSCTGNPYRTDRLDDFDRIDLVEASAGVRAATVEQLASMWVDIIAGCVMSVDDERLRRLAGQAWSASERSAALKAAEAAVDTSPTHDVTLLDAVLQMPDAQCDFAADPTCKATIPLSVDGARHILAKLKPLDEAWSSTGDASAPASTPDWKSTQGLADRYGKEMNAAANLPAEEGLVAMRTILARSEYAHLGAWLNDYYFQQGLEQWSREGHAEEALDIYNMMSKVAGSGDFKSVSRADLGLALLQLRAGHKSEALASVELANAVSPSDRVGKILGEMRAAAAGGDIAAKYPPPNPPRPWKLSRGVPICDFFGSPGLDIHTEDIIAAYHDKRRAASWSLQQEWPSVVEKCYDWQSWKKTRDNIRFAFSSTELEAARKAARDSAGKGDPTSISYLGVNLPLPNLVESDKGDFKHITAEDAQRILQQSALLEERPTQ